MFFSSGHKTIGFHRCHRHDITEIQLLTLLPQAPASHAPGAASSPPERGTLLLSWRSHPARAELEAFIGAIYARRFDARVRGYAPMLVGLCRQKTLVAAAGYRAAAAERLYLERYLDEPIEVALSRRAGCVVHRERIVEIGHLAAARSGEGLELIRRLAAYLAGQGFEWAVCTATRELRPALERLDAQPLALGAAKASQIGEEAASWGSYYAHQPVVLAVALEPALRRHARRHDARRHAVAEERP
jgi:phosphoglycolate phosphatase-like HAD superfamily hydrolase